MRQRESRRHPVAIDRVRPFGKAKQLSGSQDVRLSSGPIPAALAFGRMNFGGPADRLHFRISACCSLKAAPDSFVPPWYCPGPRHREWDRGCSSGPVVYRARLRWDRQSWNLPSLEGRLCRQVPVRLVAPGSRPDARWRCVFRSWPGGCVVEHAKAYALGPRTDQAVMTGDAGRGRVPLPRRSGAASSHPTNGGGVQASVSHSRLEASLMSAFKSRASRLGIFFTLPSRNMARAASLFLPYS